MLTIEEKNDLKFFAQKVSDVHGVENSEFVEVNNILLNTEIENLGYNEYKKLRELTSNYLISEGSCKAQTVLLTLLKKMDENVK